MQLTRKSAFRPLPLIPQLPPGKCGKGAFLAGTLADDESVDITARMSLNGGFPGAGWTSSAWARITTADRNRPASTHIFARISMSLFPTAQLILQGKRAVDATASR